MKNPTHFIEVYKVRGIPKLVNSFLLNIEYLTSELYKTNQTDCLTTIAVWKIKFKENATTPIPRKID